MQTELEKFCIWAMKEVRDNDLCVLGPFRLKSEHNTQKRYVIKPEIWLKRMTNMYNKTADKDKKMSIEETAKEFNELIKSNEIEQFIIRSNKRILRDAINEHNQKINQSS